MTHLSEVLRASAPQDYGFERVTVWGGRRTLDLIDEAPWLEKVHEPVLDRPLPWRLMWQRVTLARRAREAACTMLFVPGGSYSGTFRPFVTVSRTLLPFEGRERHRYGWSWMRLKLQLLRAAQSSTLRRADGVIFLNDYAKSTVTRTTGPLSGLVRVIPHGVSVTFRAAPRPQRPLSCCSDAAPLRILYVSTVDMYKHQWHVVDAVARLRRLGRPVHLELVGEGYAPALARLRETLRSCDPDGTVVTYRGGVPYADLPVRYHLADVFVFASSCENMPNTLLEAMASALPIACADSRPMPDILGEAGHYFNPEQPGDIAAVLDGLINDPDERARMAEVARTRVEEFTWDRCAKETLTFLGDVGGHHRCTTTEGAREIA